MALLAEDARTTARLLELIGHRCTAGRQVHDANVAVALTHGATSIATDDARRFTRYLRLISIEPLSGPHR